MRAFAGLLRDLFARIAGPAPASPQGDAFAAMRALLGGDGAHVIFDVGAYHGHVSRTFLEIFPRASVYAFEPFRPSYDALMAGATAANPRLRAFDYGLSDHEGTRTFHSNPSAATNSLLATDAAGAQTWGAGLLETREVVEARFRTLDAVMAELRLERIDILKLDVQGAEPLVMEGAAEACRRGLVGLVYAEIILQPTYRGQKRFDEVLAAYYDRGFDLYNLYYPNFDGTGRLRQVDAIFTRGQPGPA